jgi:asparagine synthase (glutamine-hydrolysing)
MSGIVGILNLDGAPVAPKLLQQMTDLMQFRGPDAQQIWIEGDIGLGHTLLKTTLEAEYERQPLTLDGQVWMVADARIDGRADLVGKLGLEDQFKTGTLTDAELILAAYQTWGEDCLQHLIGDFAFAIWDGPQQKLFCARDHFGIKPFYYSHLGNVFIFSNTLNSIRLHPGVSKQLNEQAIADFLLFDMNYDPQTTTFKDIQRLPIAHCLTLQQGQLQQRRYWSLPMPSLLRYAKPTDYLEHFQERMNLAVGDRLRCPKVAVFMSGGLDSTTIAATALEVTTNRSQPLDLQAYTCVYDTLIPDQERYYSGLAAQQLKIPIHYQNLDDYGMKYAGWPRPELATPEPCHNPKALANYDHFQQVLSHSRVILSGDGGDEALRCSTFLDCLSFMPLSEAISDVGRSLLWRSLFPPLGSRLLYRLRRKYNRNHFLDLPLPEWLDPGLVQRQQLADRWQEIRQNKPAKTDQLRSQSHGILTSAIWSLGFDSYDPSWTNVPVETRFPFLDLRLLEFLLSVPPLPWLVRKELLRAAMLSKLPTTLLKRRKTLVAAEIYSLEVCGGLKTWQPLSHWPQLAPYINAEAVLSAVAQLTGNNYQFWQLQRPLSLGYWLQQQNQI